MESEKLSRVSCRDLDSILGDKFSVLNDGFVRVIDYMGNDSAIVQAARVSYGNGTRKVSEDRGLIRYLMRHHHSTPFEMCEIKLHIRLPMDCWRQWIRHRTANVNEYSTRYSLAIDSHQTTEPDKWRTQSTNNRQGSAKNLPIEQGELLSQAESDLRAHAMNVYQSRIAQGVSREQARKDLPLSTYTEAYWKIDLHNLLNFLSLRMAIHAQLEIREYATIIGEQILAKWCPMVWEAFLDYRVNSVTFSQKESDLFALLLAGYKAKALALACDYGWIDTEYQTVNNREFVEFCSKLESFGIKVKCSELFNFFH